MEIWEPKPPGTLWATLGLLWDSFTLHTFNSFLFLNIPYVKCLSPHAEITSSNFWEVNSPLFLFMYLSNLTFDNLVCS